jgi:hypothetical protein
LSEIATLRSAARNDEITPNSLLRTLLRPLHLLSQQSAG